MLFSSSDPEVMYNGLPTGNALNDCARRHNESSGPVATYRTVKLTNAPTKSSVPSISLVPSPGPTTSPTHSPTVSSVPSIAPSTSFEPSGTPSEYPTFDFASLDEFSQIDSPGTTSFNLAHGIMFDVTAKEVDIRIHNFRIPFGKCERDTFTVLRFIRFGPLQLTPMIIFCPYNLSCRWKHDCQCLEYKRG